MSIFSLPFVSYCNTMIRRQAQRVRDGTQAVPKSNTAHYSHRSRRGTETTSVFASLIKHTNEAWHTHNNRPRNARNTPHTKRRAKHWPRKHNHHTRAGARIPSERSATNERRTNTTEHPPLHNEPRDTSGTEACAESTLAAAVEREWRERHSRSRVSVESPTPNHEHAENVEPHTFARRGRRQHAQRNSNPVAIPTPPPPTAYVSQDEPNAAASSASEAIDTLSDPDEEPPNALLLSPPVHASNHTRNKPKLAESKSDTQDDPNEEPPSPYEFGSHCFE